MKNLTLSIEEDLLRQARKVALDRDTSVNQLVREYLEGLVREQDKRAEALAYFRELRKNPPISIGGQGKITWTRDELNERF